MEGLPLPSEEGLARGLCLLPWGDPSEPCSEAELSLPRAEGLGGRSRCGSVSSQVYGEAL